MAVDTQTELCKRGIAVRVVSMPCTQVFDRQDANYRSSVLPVGIPGFRLRPVSPTTGENMSGWMKRFPDVGEIKRSRIGMLTQARSSMPAASTNRTLAR